MQSDTIPDALPAPASFEQAGLPPLHLPPSAFSDIVLPDVEAATPLAGSGQIEPPLSGRRTLGTRLAERLPAVAKLVALIRARFANSEPDCAAGGADDAAKAHRPLRLRGQSAETLAAQRWKRLGFWSLASTVALSLFILHHKVTSGPSPVIVETGKASSQLRHSLAHSRADRPTLSSSRPAARPAPRPTARPVSRPVSRPRPSLTRRESQRLTLSADNSVPPWPQVERPMMATTRRTAEEIRDDFRRRRDAARRAR